VELSSAGREVVNRLLKPRERTGDASRDTIAAFEKVKQIRQQNTHDGGVLIEELYRDTKSLRTTAYLLKITVGKLRRWRRPPDAPEPEDQDES
jgi:hypothetical protein